MFRPALRWEATRLPDTPTDVVGIAVNDLERMFHKTIRKRIHLEGELSEVLCDIYHVTYEVASEKGATENARN